jgi:hypothetical protein
MTNADNVEFLQAFNRLAVATRLPAAEADGAMQRVYWDGLSELPIDAVVAAAEAMEKSAQWFPKVSEWREAGYRHQVSERLKLPEGRDEPWHDECGACSDTGWELRHCYPGTAKNCGHRNCVKGRREEHDYVERCTCRETNRTYQRNQAVLTGSRA